MNLCVMFCCFLSFLNFAHFNFCRELKWVEMVLHKCGGSKLSSPVCLICTVCVLLWGILSLSLPGFNCPRDYRPLTSKQLRSNSIQDDISRQLRSPRLTGLLVKQRRQPSNRKQKLRRQSGIESRLWKLPPIRRVFLTDARPITHNLNKVEILIAADIRIAPHISIF